MFSEIFAMSAISCSLVIRWGQGRIWGVCLVVMTDPFAPQVLSINADKISNAVTAGLKCGCF